MFPHMFGSTPFYMLAWYRVCSYADPMTPRFTSGVFPQDKYTVNRNKGQAIPPCQPGKSLTLSPQYSAHVCSTILIPLRACVPCPRLLTEMFTK